MQGKRSTAALLLNESFHDLKRFSFRYLVVFPSSSPSNSLFHFGLTSCDSCACHQLQRVSAASWSLGVLLSALSATHAINCESICSSRFSEDELDSSGLALYTLGNLGGKAINANGTVLDGSSGATRVDQDGDALQRVITVPLFGTTYSVTRAANLVTLADFAYSTVFLLFILWWIFKYRSVNRSLTDGDVNVSDYAVYVTGLPKNATSAAVRDHFDGLYNLRKPDWTWPSRFEECLCNRKVFGRRKYVGAKKATALYNKWVGRVRPRSTRSCCSCCSPSHSGDTMRDAPVNWEDFAATPVLNASNTADESYLRSWVAEVTLVHPNGKLLRRYKDLQGLRDLQLHTRAAIRKYKSKGWTPAQSGGLCGGKYEVVWDCSCAAGRGKCVEVRSGAVATRLAAARTRLAAIEARIHKLDLKHAQQLNTDVLGAFVVFNNEESLLRCLNDYQSSTRWYSTAGRMLGCFQCCQPPPLLFNHTVPLKVRRAPEPSDVIWENLETPPWERGLRVLGVNLGVLLFVAASMVGILLAEQQQSALNDILPPTSVCGTFAPAVVHGLEAVQSGTVDVSLDRAPADDALCSTALGRESVYLWWKGSGAVAPPADLQPSMRNITALDGSFVSTVVNPCSSPCVPNDVNSEELCVVASEDGGSSQQFPVRNLLGCYCVDLLQSALQEGDSLGDMLENKVCTEFASSFLAAQALVVVAAAGVVLINSSLETLLEVLTTLERHNSVARQKAAVASKLFLSLFLNTGLIVMLVNARIPGAETVPTGVLAGEHSSFEPGWYASAGAAITLTMAINIIGPHVKPVVKYACLGPCGRRCSQKEAILQAEMNQLYSPPEFDIQSRVPHVMNTVMVTMLYSSGIPLLLPIAFLALLVTYYTDMLLLLRFYARPPPLDDSMARMAANILPMALISHLAFAVWFYGDENSVESTPVDLGGGAEDAQATYDAFVAALEPYDSIGFAPKLLRQNVFPMFVMFLVLGPFAVFVYTAWRVGLGVLRRAMFCVSCGKCCSGIQEETGKMDPVFTATFEHRLPIGTPFKLTRSRAIEGWCLIQDIPRHPKAVSRVCRYKPKVLLEDRNSKDRVLMLTWEVIRDRTGVASYAMTANPEYAQAVLALEEAALKAGAHRASTALRALATVMGGAHPQAHHMGAGRAAPYAMSPSGAATASANRGTIFFDELDASDDDRSASRASGAGHGERGGGSPTLALGTPPPQTGPGAKYMPRAHSPAGNSPTDGSVVLDDTMLPLGATLSDASAGQGEASSRSHTHTSGRSHTKQSVGVDFDALPMHDDAMAAEPSQEATGIDVPLMPTPVLSAAAASSPGFAPELPPAAATDTVSSTGIGMSAMDFKAGPIAAPASGGGEASGADSTVSGRSHSRAGSQTTRLIIADSEALDSTALLSPSNILTPQDVEGANKLAFQLDGTMDSVASAMTSKAALRGHRHRRRAPGAQGAAAPGQSNGAAALASALDETSLV